MTKEFLESLTTPGNKYSKDELVRTIRGLKARVF
jgi:hypothetical protein